VTTLSHLFFSNRPSIAAANAKLKIGNLIGQHVVISARGTTTKSGRMLSSIKRILVILS